MKKVKFLIFDIDRTLLNNKDVYGWILERVLNSNPNSFLSKLYFTSLKEDCSSSKSRLREKLDNLVYIFFQGIDFKRPKMFKRAKEFLGLLRKDGVKIFGSTCSDNLRTKRVLGKVGIFDFFELILGREFPKVKHIPIFANYVGMSLARFSFNTFLVGDEIRDMILGKQFNLSEVIGFTNTHDAKLLVKYGADRTVNNFGELIDLYSNPAKMKKKKVHQAIA